MRNQFAAVAAITLLLAVACSKKEKNDVDPSAECKTCGESLKSGDEVVKFKNKEGKTITLLKNGNQYKLDHDVYLTDRQVALLKGDIKVAGNGRTAGLPGFIQLWPSRTIPYTLHSSLADPQVVLDAIAHWQSKTNLQFVQRTTQANYVEFKDIDGSCGSHVGMIGGAQRINIGPFCSVGNAIHEIGHAVGFYHEISRRDRNSSIIMNWSNVQPGWETEFQTYVERGLQGFETGYTMDFNSIMMYGSYAAAINPNIPVWTDLSGNTYPRQQVLSDQDVNLYNLLYNPPNYYINDFNRVRVTTPDGRGYEWESEIRITDPTGVPMTWPHPIEFTVWVHEMSWDGTYSESYTPYVLPAGQSSVPLGYGWQIVGAGGESSMKYTAVILYD